MSIYNAGGLEKRLAKGVASWLMFEYQCHRGLVFSERYLTFPISQILTMEFSKGVIAEYQHPILSKFKTGKGRRPEIDFAVVDVDNNLRVAVETKWVPYKPTKKYVESILWDLIRLASIGNNEYVSCYFVIAGKSQYLKKLFDHKSFRGPKTPAGRYEPILKVKKEHEVASRIDSPKEWRINLLKSVMQTAPDIKLPIRLGVSRTQVWPKDPINSEYQVFAWEVLPNVQTKEFYPARHALYGNSKSATPKVR